MATRASPASAASWASGSPMRHRLDRQARQSWRGRSRSAHAAMLASTASRRCPEGVSSYTTRGGISAYAVRVTSPVSTNRCNRDDSVFGLMPGSPSRSSVKRLGPVRSSRTMSVAHGPSKTVRNRATGHSGSGCPRSFTISSPGLPVPLGNYSRNPSGRTTLRPPARSFDTLVVLLWTRNVEDSSGSYATLTGWTRLSRPVLLQPSRMPEIYVMSHQANVVGTPAVGSRVRAIALSHTAT